MATRKTTKRSVPKKTKPAATPTRAQAKRKTKRTGGRVAESGADVGC